jgi:cell division protein FtsB
MSEMSCKTCRRWAAGWCLAQQLGTSRDEVCNAWELSRVVEWEDENEKLQARIAELEAENTALKQHPQPIEFWSDEKKELYRRNESRTIKSGREEECEE